MSTSKIAVTTQFEVSIQTENILTSAMTGAKICAGCPPHNLIPLARITHKMVCPGLVPEHTKCGANILPYLKAVSHFQTHLPHKQVRSLLCAYIYPASILHSVIFIFL
jgi:hypothetical protein